MNKARIARLQDQMADQQFDGVVLLPGTSMIYLTGVHGHISERPFLIFLMADGTVAAIVPGLEAMKIAAVGVPETHIFDWTDQGGYGGAFSAAAKALGLDGKRIGVESLSMRVVELHALQQHAPEIEIAYADPLVGALRLCKDDDEIAALQAAVDVAESALVDVLPTIKVGQTEKEIAAAIFQALLAAGADEPSFGTIVSGGPNAASPHAVPTNRPIQNGDLVVIDFGARVGDYVSDITRTFAVGNIDDEARTIYELVKGANAAGVAAAQFGASGQDIDRAARAVIEAGGYGEQFFHRTGHGLGMEPHEPPSMMEGNTTPLPAGAVFTVEPGIYLAGRNGVRIEDNVVITENGPLVLTSLPRDLRSIG